MDVLDVLCPLDVLDVFTSNTSIRGLSVAGSIPWVSKAVARLLVCDRHVGSIYARDTYGAVAIRA